MNGVAVIEIARPEKKNALTQAMYTAMAEAIVAADADARRSARVLITGQPGIFTSGNDLEDFMQRPPQGEDSPVFAVHEGADRAAASRWSRPSPAAAIGIGTTMLLHCDLVYVSDEARLAMPFVSLGLVPEYASSLLMPQLMGHVHGRRAAAAGRAVQRRPTRSRWASPTRCCRPPRSSTTRAAWPSASTRCRRAPCARARR